MFSRKTPFVLRSAARYQQCMQKSTFRVLGLQQIAVGSGNKQALSGLWVDTFGLKKKGTFRSEKENVDEDILQCGRGPFSVEVDIMQPLDPNKSPKVHVPPLNHIGLWIDDLPKCVEELTAKGVRFTPGGIRKGAAGFNVAFIHPKGNESTPLSGEGVLIELVQAPDNIIKAFDAVKEE
ncbi:hypothetical protein PHYBOEH_008151 [Phytophthora boehmeriae]|uniref:VOC domain-containing protein n=1 Tax=Phytophthora boehmeriae TaxID=109152 RepID=A0A8T1W549_9STRA|nr:hypothetical protein PHYBOEH_008151 [Phytophthora boehmeriae]